MPRFNKNARVVPVAGPYRGMPCRVVEYDSNDLVLVEAPGTGWRPAWSGRFDERNLRDFDEARDGRL